MLNIKVGNLIRFNSDVARTRNLHTVYRVVRVTPQGFFTALRGWLTHNGRGWNSHDSHETAFCPADLRDFHLVAKDIYSLPPEPEPLTGSYDVHKTPSRPKFACYEEELAFLLKDAGPLSGIPTRHAYNWNDCYDCYDLEVGAVVKLRSGPLCEYRGEKNPEGAYIVHLLDGGSDRLLWGSPDVCSVVYLPSREGSPNALSAREEALAKLCKDAPVLPCDTKGEWGDCCLVLQPGDVVRNLEGTLHEYRGQKGSGDTYVLHCLSPGRGFARADTWYGSSHVFKLVHRRAPRRADLVTPAEVKPEVAAPTPAPSVTNAKPSLTRAEAIAAGVEAPAPPKDAPNLDYYLTPPSGAVVRHKTGSSLIKKGAEFRVESADGGQRSIYSLLSTTSPLRISDVRLLGDVWEVVPQPQQEPPLADVFDCLTLKVGDVVRRRHSGLDLSEPKGAPFKVVTVLPPGNGYRLEPILPNAAPTPSAVIERMGSGLCWELVTHENSLRVGTRLQVLPKQLSVRKDVSGRLESQDFPRGTVFEVTHTFGDHDDRITVSPVSPEGRVLTEHSYHTAALRHMLAEDGHSLSFCLVRDAAATPENLEQPVTGAPFGATAGSTNPLIVVQSSKASGTGEGGGLAFDLGQTPTPKRPVTARILTHSGQLLDVLNPDPKAIMIGDIAHALSQKVRWGGHSVRPITIAEHSVRVARVARYLCNERQLDKDAALRIELAALLHDAAEAYIGDVPKPIKNALPVWDNQIENPLQHAILKAFNCEVASAASDSTIKLADQLMNQIELETHMPGFWSLSQEQREAASAYTGDRQLLQRVAVDPSIFWYDFLGRNSPASVWESNFLHRFSELTAALAK